MKLIGVETLEGTTYINPEQIVYFRDLFGDGSGKIEVFTTSPRDGRIVIIGHADKFANLIDEFMTGG